MELKKFIQLSKRYLWAVILLTVLAAGVAYLFSTRITPIYASSATLLINQARADSAVVDINMLRASESIAKTYTSLLVKRSVLTVVIDNLKLNTTPERLARNVSATVPSETQLIMLTVQDPDPNVAAAVANEIVSVFNQTNRSMQLSRYADYKQKLALQLDSVKTKIIEANNKIQELEKGATTVESVELSEAKALLAQNISSYATLSKSYEDLGLIEAQMVDPLQVMDPAQPSSAPIGPPTGVYVLVAAFIAAMLALATVYAIAYFDTTIRSRQEIEQIPELTTLAEIGGDVESTRLVTLATPHSFAAESYRVLRANIEFSAVNQSINTLLVMSSVPNEGQNVVSANLAITLAQAGKRIILIDANLRESSLHTLFDIPNTQGLTSALMQSDAQAGKAFLLPTNINGLQIMPSGPLPPNPAEMLGAPRMAELVRELATDVDMVIMNSSPAVVVDPMLLGRISDATLLVARAGLTRVEALTHTRNQLLQAGNRLIGVVLVNSQNAITGAYGSGNSSAGFEGWSRRLNKRTNPSSPLGMAMMPAQLAASPAAVLPVNTIYAEPEQHAMPTASVPEPVELQTADALPTQESSSGLLANGDHSSASQRSTITPVEPRPGDTRKSSRRRRN